ncbi:aromatic ring-hydroxylating dioxygenase subunit alpha [Zavarzinia compransoris]|uniref:aromatic ring-hydroxylating oxygenase subunit alpha n=1 Tax=Zavarzinia marina TaxID=2911065 RepID=UPI001F2D71EB|nr:aromatic ring-hydroxylating dioxygenase subunit alpha [Zavarzinia marina]MCF4167317.1 aromatic ring-hydroxylating dioxygenase subunit alpha [Zavarzinia marina]
MSTVQTILEALEPFATAPPAVPRAMPAPFYTDADFLTLEEEAVFRKEWVCLGHAGEIPKPGDYFTTDLVGEPLLVVRGRDGAVRVLSNVCRHRGNVVAEGKGNARLFSCAYHAWSYKDDGGLVAAPLMDKVPGFDKADCGLIPFRTELWQNFVFVNLDGKAAPLAPRLEGLLPHIDPFQHQDRISVFVTDDVWATNWKCLVENFMEGYHLTPTHPRTLHPITPTSLCRKIPGTVDYTAYESHYSPDTPERTPYHPRLPETHRRHSTLFCVFPSFVVSYASHFTLYLCLRPKGVGEVAIHWGVAGYVDSVDAPEVAPYVALCNAFNAEDKAKLETLIKGLRSRAYVPGLLAPDDLEGTIVDFYRFMADRLADI